MGNTAAAQQNYQLDTMEKISQGSFGIVYKIKQSHKQYVAMKVLQIPFNDMDDSSLLSFQRELEILKSLDHPNVIKFIDQFKDDHGRICFVTEYANGGDLDQLIANKFKNESSLFSEKQIQEMTVMIGLGLHYIHGQGIIHRDLKPSNILVHYQDDKNLLPTLKIADFGTSKSLCNNNSDRETLMDTYSLEYSSFDQINQEEPSYKFDMWALGCIIYKMCCGRVPFSNPKRQKTIELIREGTYDPIPEIYSQEIRDLVNSLLNKNADFRPSIDEIFNIPWVQEVSEKFNAVTSTKQLEIKKLHKLRIDKIPKKLVSYGLIGLQKVLETAQQLPSNMRMQAYKEENIKESYIPERKPNPMI